MLIVIDDFFDTETLEKLAYGLRYKTIPGFIPFQYLHHMPKHAQTIFGCASKYFDLTSAIGVEMWSTVDFSPSSWHTDNDTKVFFATGEEKYPLCTTVFYPYVDPELVGGCLETKDITVKPITNRLVMFSPGVLHNVQPYEGKRISLVYNPWDYNPHPE